MTTYLSKAAAKLYRGEQTQGLQLDRTQRVRQAHHRSFSWSEKGLTRFDAEILARRAFPSPDFFNDRESGGAYLASLNA